MSSPNEPGETSAPATAGNGGEPSGGAPERPTTVIRQGSSGGPWLNDVPSRPDSGDAPPWQRAAGRGQQSGPRPPVETTTRTEQRPAASAPATPAPSAPATPAPTPNAPAPTPDPRLNRYVTGTAAPAAFQQPKPASTELEPTATRTEVARPPEYASEIPDLSGPTPRPPAQRRGDASGPSAPVATATAARSTGNRIQVGRNKSGPVRASMQIRRVDPWSALKVSLLLSIALFFVWMIAVAFLYLVLGGMGVWSKLNSNVGDLLTANSGSGGELVSAGSIFGGALLIGLVNIVLLTAMATIGAFVYNLTTDIVGGVEVTLADRD